ncbi:MAG TPA: response regulator transcription factor [Chitinophagaceae bacterium]|nr:response regulator transcription factor [Chitinophagaceae bacterium]
MLLRLIIADDHPLLVNGLTTVLEEMENVQLLAPAANGRQLLEALRKTPADIALVDLNMPHLDGIATLRILGTEFPSLKVIVFTNYDQPKLVSEIKNLGAKGYLLKTSNSIVLKEAITAVAEGKTYFQEQGAASQASAQFADDFTKKFQITKREVEILRMIAQGLTTRQISERLFVSEFTISAHRRNICRKLNIYTPVGLLNFSREHGLV